jgi:Ca2+-binding RTX toxin-like protein
MHDPAVANAANSNNTTRFCTTAQATCEPTGAFGTDTMFGDSGDDTMWGQDGNDTMHGGDGHDDVYGELGNDQLFGDNGNDVLLGDRGGAVDTFMNDTSKQFVVSTNSPPAESYTGMRQGTLDHRVDLLHDIDGDVFVGSSTSASMPHAGLNEGGDDRIHGGNGQDNIHGGFGDDLANGDSGGDSVFGDDGADALWGGKGCDAAIDTIAVSPDCYTAGVFDPTARGTNDRFVDHMWGGTGGTSAASQAGALGSDIMDWRPRGAPAACTSNPWPVTIGNQTNDPCSWFQMTNTDDDTANTATLANNQHHQGTDWMYGGWDRDVMQGDVAQNGPNGGDRLLDWTGAYNLYTHCNSAYGGFNDVRQQSPAMQTFLLQTSFGDGAGQLSTDTAASGTSAFRELALVYPSDINGHGGGKDYPSTPGHFDSPSSCAP